MRSLIPAIGLAILWGCVLRAQQPSGHEECERKIRSLEQRLARVEDMLAQLAAQQASPPVAPAPLADTPMPARNFEMPPELVPQIGKIGAEVGVLMALASSPFQLNRGSMLTGFIDLPLFEPRKLHGKLAYEISVGMAQSRTTFPVTSNVAQVANLAVLNALNPSGGLQNVNAALTGTGAAPFPVKVSALTRLRVLEVVPFAFRYTSTALDRWRIRPYGLLGFGTYVTIHNQIPARGEPAGFGLRPDAALPPGALAALQAAFGGQAPFGGPLVAGQISQSPELEARGLPGGHGNIDFGAHMGGGVEFRISRGFSLGLDARYNKIAGTNGGFATVGSRFGFHF